MGLWDAIRGEFIDIIEWRDAASDTMVYRFDRRDREIKNGAQLVVREGQTAVFVNEGLIADVFDPGTHQLATRNLPILSKLKGWKYGFESPFKAEVYYVSTRQFTDLKWGTKNPIMLRDPEFGPVRLRAFGTYVIRVDDVTKFLKQIVGTDGHFTVDEITNQIRNVIVARFADVLGEGTIPVLSLAANYQELGEFVLTAIRSELQGYGLELKSLLVENISLPEAVEKVLDERTSMGVIGDLSQYMRFKSAGAIGDAANNPGMAGGAMGMGMGFAMANQMADAARATTGASANVGPPPLPGSAATAFWVAQNGQQTGPFDLATLGRMVANRTLAADTLVWKAGMPAWQQAAMVAEIESLLRQVPPPLPPAPPIR